MKRFVQLQFLAIFFGTTFAASGQQRSVDDQLQLINRTFHQRLESTYKHQQAVMPAGYTSVKRYLQFGPKRHLLEYALNDPASGLQMREDYSLRFLNHDTVQVSMGHYVTGGRTREGDHEYCLAFSSEYLNDSYFEAYNLLITQNFDPMAVLALRPGAAQNRQWLYARSAQPHERGDTVASYHLLRSRTGDTCRVQLYERPDEQRPWRHHHRLACTWVVELTRRRLMATWMPAPEHSSLYTCVRTYRTATDFIETLTISYRVEDVTPSNETALVYKRDFQQISPSESIDKFTVADGSAEAKTLLTFSVVSFYR